jgi:hypothetical protein
VANETTWEEADQLCDEILEMIDEIPERGENFGASVMAKVEDIQKTIKETERVTSGQLTALENMKEGVQKWIR